MAHVDQAPASDDISIVETEGAGQRGIEQLPGVVLELLHQLGDDKEKFRADVPTALALMQDSAFDPSREVILRAGPSTYTSASPSGPVRHPAGAALASDQHQPRGAPEAG